MHNIILKSQINLATKNISWIVLIYWDRGFLTINPSKETINIIIISSVIWNMVPICLMWTIWKERNQRTFEDVCHLDYQILESFTSTLFEWSRTWGCTSSSSLMEFSSSLYLISHDVNLWSVSVHTLCTLHSYF